MPAQTLVSKPRFSLSRARYDSSVRFLWAVPLLLSAETDVDPRVCAGCHQEIAKTYAQTGMGRSFHRVPPNAGFEAAPFLHERSGTWYSMSQRGGETFQRRWRIDPAGREIDVRELRVDYVMGSGNHARTFLHRTERGALLELDLGWY